MFNCNTNVNPDWRQCTMGHVFPTHALHSIPHMVMAWWVLTLPGWHWGLPLAFSIGDGWLSNHTLLPLIIIIIHRMAHWWFPFSSGCLDRLATGSAGMSTLADVSHVFAGCVRFATGTLIMLPGTWLAPLFTPHQTIGCRCRFCSSRSYLGQQYSLSWLGDVVPLTNAVRHPVIFFKARQPHLGRPLLVGPKYWVPLTQDSTSCGGCFRFSWTWPIIVIILPIAIIKIFITTIIIITIVRIVRISKWWTPLFLFGKHFCPGVVYNHYGIQLRNKVRAPSDGLGIGTIYQLFPCINNGKIRVEVASE